MHVWLDLISRELLFLALLAAIGAGPATFLSERFDGVARLAMAPVFGLCVGVCVTVTLVYFFPTSETWWVVILLALVSLGVAARRRGTAPPWLGRRGLIQLAVVAIVVMVSFDYPLALRHTVGPAGGWAIADTTGYVSEINGEARQGIHRAEQNRPPFADLSMYYWSAYASGFQQLDVSALEANVNQMLGLGSTDTDSALLIVIIMTGALGVFAVIRTVSGVSTWGAAVGGCLFGGPLFVRAVHGRKPGGADGQCAARAGGGVRVGGACRTAGRATLVLFALLIAGLQTVYPLFLPPIVLGAAVAIAIARCAAPATPTTRRQERCCSPSAS